MEGCTFVCNTNALSSMNGNIEHAGNRSRLIAIGAAISHSTIMIGLLWVKTRLSSKDRYLSSGDWHMLETRQCKCYFSHITSVQDLGFPASERNVLSDLIEQKQFRNSRPAYQFRVFIFQVGGQEQLENGEEFERKCTAESGETCSATKPSSNPAKPLPNRRLPLIDCTAPTPTHHTIPE
jgi:hypothetical protein